MNKRSGTFKALALLAMVVLMAGVAFAVLHHHTDGSGHSFDCGACQLAKQIVLAFVLVFICAFAGFEKCPEVVRVFETNPNSRFFTSPRKGRAPPASF